MRKIINTIIGYLKLLSFLLWHDKDSKRITAWITATAISICVGLRSFPLSHLSSTGVMLPDKQIIIRLIGTGIFLSVWLSLLICLAFTRYKKYKNTHELKYEELENFLKHMT